MMIQKQEQKTFFSIYVLLIQVLLWDFQINSIGLQRLSPKGEYCHMQVHPSRNYIPVVKSFPKHTSPPSIVATFFATCLITVLQPFRYSIFHSGDTPIQLSLP